MSANTQEQAHDVEARAADGHAELEAVRSLMDERRRFEGWLETLETRRESTPARVYERVRGDYETRLDEVIAKLRGHTAMLRTTLTDLNEQAQGLRAEEDSRREERAENELRAVVGEYTPEYWAELAAAADAEIDRLWNERGALTADIARFQEMLAHTEAPRTPPAGQAVVQAAEPAYEPEPAAEPEPEPVVAQAEPVVEPEPVVAQAPVEHEAPSDESSLRALYGAESEPTMPAIDALRFDDEAEAAADAVFSRPSERRAPATSEPAAGMLNGAMAFDELAFLKSVVGPRNGASAGEVAAPRSGPAAAVQDRVGNRREGSSTPGFAEAAKTLRCGECGTMNAPTEWYCERCGGELAAL